MQCELWIKMSDKCTRSHQKLVWSDVKDTGAVKNSMFGTSLHFSLSKFPFDIISDTKHDQETLFGLVTLISLLQTEAK